MSRLALFCLLTFSFLLTGCETLLIAGATTGAVASQDPRDLSTQIDDQKAEIKSFSTIFSNDELWKDTNISVVSYNHVILIFGQAPTATLKEKAEEEIQKIAGENKVHNQIRIAAPVSFWATRNDEYLTTKIKTAMLFTSDFPSAKIKVVTEDGEVFLLGIVTREEADKAVEIARNISGVKKVIKAFEYQEAGSS